MKSIKYTLSVFILFLFITISKGQSTPYDTIRYAPEHYSKRVALFEKEPIQKGKIIFLGNSITELGDWPKLLNNPTVINRGIAGDNTFGVLDRLDDIIAREPDKLFIKIGINDIAQGIPTHIIVKNITSIIEQIKNRLPQTKIYVHSILPTNDNVKVEYPDAFNKNSLVNEVNDELRKSKVKLRFVFIDLNRELSDKYGNLDVKYADPDGLHLNEAGYKAWINLLKEKRCL